MTHVAQVILLVLQAVQGFLTRQSKMERARRVLKIRQDPIAEWNRRFKRVPNDGRAKKPKLPPDDPRSTGHDERTRDTH